MSNRKLAKVLGVSHTAMNKAAKSKRFVSRDPEKAKKELEANTRPKADSPFGGGAADDPFRKAAAMERIQRARLLKVKADAAERNSISREDAQQIATDLVIALREHILNMIPQRCDAMAAELGVQATALKQVLRRHVTEHMNAGIRELQGNAA